LAHVWVKCLTIVRAADSHGVLRTYQPGDWAQIGKHQARQLVAQGCAEIKNPVSRAVALDLGGCGVVASGDTRVAKMHLTLMYPELEVVAGSVLPELPFPRTLIWNPQTKVDLKQLPVGFHRLTTGWWAAAPLLPHPELEHDYLTAGMIGSDAERALTRSVIRDLRCPVYDPGLFFVLRRPEMEVMMRDWLDEQDRGSDVRLALLRAIYRHPLPINPLPSTWYG